MEFELSLGIFKGIVCYYLVALISKFCYFHLSVVSKKHGKLITFLRTFMKSRPTKQKLKQRGILKERVFGCDLGEHLLNSGHDGEERETLDDVCLHLNLSLNSDEVQI